MAVLTRDGRRVHRLRRAQVAAQAAARDRGTRYGGEGRLQALHAQGDLRAAAGGPRDVRGRVSLDTGRVLLDELRISADDLRGFDRVTMLACGTSWHAALVGKFLIEQLARLPVEVDYGSEYRYRDPIVGRRRRWRSSSRSRARRPTRWPRCAKRKAQGRAQHRDLQRRRQHGHARGRRHALHARRPRDRRRLDQGVHHAARRAVPARALPRRGARHARRRGRAASTSRRCCSCRS